MKSVGAQEAYFTFFRRHFCNPLHKPFLTGRGFCTEKPKQRDVLKHPLFLQVGNPKHQNFGFFLLSFLRHRSTISDTFLLSRNFSFVPPFSTSDMTASPHSESFLAFLGTLLNNFTTILTCSSTTASKPLNFDLAVNSTESKGEESRHDLRSQDISVADIWNVSEEILPSSSTTKLRMQVMPRIVCSIHVKPDMLTALFRKPLI